MATASVAGQLEARRFNGLGETAAHRAKNECGNVTFRFDHEGRGFVGKLETTVELEPRFPQELRRKTQVGGAIDTPEPEFLLVALKEMEGFFELSHGAIERRGQEKDAEPPCMTGVLDANPYAIFAGLIALNTAAIVVAEHGRAASG